MTTKLPFIDILDKTLLGYASFFLKTGFDNQEVRPSYLMLFFVQPSVRSFFYYGIAAQTLLETIFSNQMLTVEKSLMMLLFSGVAYLIRWDTKVKQLPRAHLNQLPEYDVE